MTAITALTLMTYIAMEVTYDTQVEYVINAEHLNRIKAYYAARSGLDISLLRIKIYQTLQQSLGKNLPNNGMVEQIWQFPLMWPLQLPDGLNEVDKDQIKDKTKESLLDSSFSTVISDEGSKIDLNNLVSPSESLREITKKQILTIFENKVKSDENFSKAHSGYRFETLVNNIADWMSSKNESYNGGDKRSAYRNSGGEDYPPNRGFRTLQEVRLVAGMNDEFFRLLEPQITIYGMRGINPNTASAEVIKSIDPTITKEIADEVIKRRADMQLGGPFKDANTFFEFLEQKGARLSINRDEFPIVTDSFSSFKIQSIGNFGSSKKEIEVITLDLAKVAERAGSIQSKVDEKNNPQPKPTPTPGASSTSTSQNQTSSNKASIPKGSPRIVYWSEK
ncbi:MAG: general secretion pathway protein GspK [Bdellovibrionaceae bacterium]|nr:general secretion pathway protein GspK [Pseudobdellovibrionaceae bacterium]